MILRELLARIGFSFDDTGYKQADTAFLKLAGAATAIVAGMVVLKSKLQGTADEAAALSHQAERAGLTLGLTAEQVQALGYAQNRTAMISDGLATAMFQLTRRAEEARHGNKKLAEVFSELKIDPKLAEKPLELLLKTSDALKGIKSQGKLDKAAFNLLGRGGAAELPFFLKGAAYIQKYMEEAKEFVTFTDEEREALDSYRLAQARASTLWDSIGRRIGARVAPAFERLANATSDLILKNQALINRGIEVLGRALEWIVDKWQALTGVIKRNAQFIAIFAGLIATAMLAKAIPSIILLGRVLFVLRGQLFRMAAAWLAGFWPVAAIVAGLGLLALAIDDVLGYIQGKQSVIGDFFDEFAKPHVAGENSFLGMLKTIATGLKSFLDDVKGNGFGAAMDHLFDDIREHWQQSILDFIVWLPKINVQLAAWAVEAGALIGQSMGRAIVGALIKEHPFLAYTVAKWTSKLGDIASNAEGLASNIPSFGGSNPGVYGTGLTPASAPAVPFRFDQSAMDMGQGPLIQGSTYNVTINGAADAHDTAKKLGDVLKDHSENERRNIAATLRSNARR